jgi:hypothetical protein
MARVGNAIEGSQHVMPWKASAGRHRGWQAHSFLGACLEVVSTGSLPSLAALGRTLGSPWPHGGWVGYVSPQGGIQGPPFMELLELPPFALVVVLEPFLGLSGPLAWDTIPGSHVVVQLVPQD